MKLIHLDREQTKEIERRRHETHDRRIYERLSAVLWVVAGKDRFDVADLLGRSVRQVAEWLRIYRNAGLDALCTLHPQGDPGKLTGRQIGLLKEEIKTGRFRNSDCILRFPAIDLQLCQRDPGRIEIPLAAQPLVFLAEMGFADVQHFAIGSLGQVRLTRAALYSSRLPHRKP